VNVCFVNEYFPPFAPGGAEWSLEALGRAMARRGHGVTVVTPNYGAAAREEREGVRIVRFPFPIRLAPGRTPAPAKWLANPFFYAWAALAVARAARRAGAEVIHAQNKHSLIPATIAGRLLRIPVERPNLRTFERLGFTSPRPSGAGTPSPPAASGNPRRSAGPGSARAR